MILNETVAAIADAIREKTGKSELIAPVDFAEEIKGITAGGGSGEGGGSNVEYLDVSGLGFEEKASLAGFAGLLCKVAPDGLIATPIAALVSGDQIDPTKTSGMSAIMVDLSLEIYVFEQKMTIQEFLGNELLDSIPRLTKEQFYDLNA
jgi:hypothetical protein